MAVNDPKFFHHFQSDITGATKPEVFTFPFCYDPDELSKIAVKELQRYLEEQQDFPHNGGLTRTGPVPSGNMFGVLVVEGQKGRLRYLAACSGKLGGTNQHTYFAPPILDMLTKDSFIRQEEEQNNTISTPTAEP